MIYLLCKHDIISVPSYAVGIYHPPKVGIILKIYHPFREERISLKTPSLYHNEGVFMAQKEGFEVASQPLLRCPKKFSGAARAFPRFFRPLRPPLLASSPSARSQALPTPEPSLRFKSPFPHKNQKQPPVWTTAFCLED